MHSHGKYFYTTLRNVRVEGDTFTAEALANALYLRLPSLRNRQDLEIHFSNEDCLTI